MGTVTPGEVECCTTLSSSHFCTVTSLAVVADSAPPGRHNGLAAFTAPWLASLPLLAAVLVDKDPIRLEGSVVFATVA